MSVFSTAWENRSCLSPLDEGLQRLLGRRKRDVIITPGALAESAEPGGRVWTHPRRSPMRPSQAAAAAVATWLAHHGRSVAIADLWAAPMPGGRRLDPRPALPALPRLIATCHGRAVIIGMDGCLGLSGPCPLATLPLADLAWLLAFCPATQGEHPLDDLLAPTPWP